MEVFKVKGTSWLVYNGNRGILIDTWMSNCKSAILDKVKSLKLDIPVILMTHTHIDHAGSLEEIRKATGAKVLVGAKEADNLRKGISPVPVGNTFLGKVLSKAVSSDKGKGNKYTPVNEDIVEINAPQPLGFGFDAEVYTLGAHTEGSIGLKMGEYFFAGDVFFNFRKITEPPFAYDVPEIKAAWKKIIDSGAKYVCPGHGKMVTMSELEKTYKKLYE